MDKKFYSLGLMSGTSMDGIDASIIYSNGVDILEVVQNKYFKYDDNFINKLSDLKNKINTSSDLKLCFSDLNILERELTILHAKFAGDILKDFEKDIDLVGFHGQTIYHNPDEKISKQLGDVKLLSQLIKKKIVFNFRKNDIENNGNGAPLAPIYHSAITKKINKKNIIYLNIGGIANETFIDKNFNISAKDLGPGNCLIDLWIRQNTEKKYDKDGNIAKSGKISKSASKLSSKYIICCGGGRKNKYLIERLEKKINKKILNIDEFEIDGDFIESQAFAFLAIRSFLNLPISFPMTTGCNKDTTGGEII